MQESRGFAREKLKLAFEAEHDASYYSKHNELKVCYIKAMKMLIRGGDAMDDGYGYAVRSPASPICCF
jgi:hypothetical protein